MVVVAAKSHSKKKPRMRTANLISSHSLLRHSKQADKRTVGIADLLLPLAMPTGRYRE